MPQDSNRLFTYNPPFTNIIYNSKNEECLIDTPHYVLSISMVIKRIDHIEKQILSPDENLEDIYTTYYS